MVVRVPYKFAHLYSQPISISGEVKQIVATIDADDITGLKVGISSGSLSDWPQFNLPSSPSSWGGRKFIIPDRGGTETLVPKDSYAYTAIYGPWAVGSTVSITTEDGTVLDPGTYVCCPTEGEVVFSSAKMESLYISITPSTAWRVGVEVENPQSVVNILSMSLMHQTDS